MNGLCRISLRILFVAVICLGQFRAIGQFIGFEITSDRKSWSFPFENFNNLIIVPVTLNHLLPLKFILDTGVRTTLLTDRTISDLVNVSYDRAVTISGAGQIREINAYVASNVSISLPGIEGKGQSLIVLEEDYLELRDYLGANVHGILGYEFFNAFVVTIDYTSSQVIVTEPAAFKPPKHFSAVPFELVQARPYINTILTQTDGSKVKAAYLIDSGASHSILIEFDTNEEIIIPENRIETLIGRGLGGDLHGFFARLPAFQFDNYIFTDLLASYTSNYSDSVTTLLTARNGSIGGELLSRFTTIFDYSRQVLYLRKNKNFKNSFEYNMSGMELVAKGLNFERKEIILVVDDSPAQKAGVRQGDKIITINGSLARDMTLNDMNYLLRTKPGKKINMLLDRSGQKFRVRFHLARMV